MAFFRRTDRPGFNSSSLRLRDPFRFGRESLVLAVACLLGSAVQAEIFRCELANGVVEYNNTTSANKERNCKRVDLPQITTIPAPKFPAAAGGSANKAGAQSAAKSSSPSDFPKVDASTQKARDTDRKRIIEDELKREEAKLAELKKTFNGGEPERQGDERNFQKYQDRVDRMREEINRVEANVGSLRKELASVKN